MHTLWSDSSNHLSLGVAMPLGVVTGSVATAAWRHEFRLELFGDASDLDRHALGAALMGVGGVTALGCSMGQGVRGLFALSAALLAVVASMGVSVVVALRCLAWRVERED